MTRFQKATKNILFSTGSYLVQLALSMLVRIFFVRYIGREYLGLNSVYASILSTMSIADLGLDTVFIFLLYKPLKLNNINNVSGILNEFKMIYRYIAYFITFIGVILIPFLPRIIGNKNSLPGIYIIFILYVLNSVVGYLNSYKRSIFIADENSYFVSGVTSGILILVNVIQIFQIFIYPSPILYIVIQVAGTIVTNLIINKGASRKYDAFFKNPNAKLSKVQKSTLVRNGIGGISNKIGSIVVVSSDNILLAIFTNLITVGMYSNYTVITTAFTKIMQTISSAIVPSLGQLGVDASKEKLKKIFLELNFVVYTIALFFFFAFYGYITPFITIWLGKNNVFNDVLTWLVSINLWLNLIRVPSWVFADSFGLQWVQKWKAIYESIINLIVSLTLLVFFKLGIEGIIIGTIISTLSTVIWFEPWTVFKYVIPEMTLRKYFTINSPFIVLVLIFSVLLHVIPNFMITTSSILNNFLNSSFYIFSFSMIYLGIFYRNVYFRKMLKRILSLKKLI